MALGDLSNWLDEFDKPNAYIWYVKRLSANDTLANRAHQAGPYVPKGFLFDIFPALRNPHVKNPRVQIEVFIDSHADHVTATAIWYNGKVFGDGTRNEARITNFGGKESPLLNPESTGALTVFAFALGADKAATSCHVWVCDESIEEDLIEERIGPVDPKQAVFWEPGVGRPDLFHVPARADCRLKLTEIPPAWLTKFPSGAEVIRKAVELRPVKLLKPDDRLMKRRKCEYEVFQSVEEAFFLPKIKGGFSTIKDFVGMAQSILQSRKSRAGNSLELHAHEIFMEEGLKPFVDFQHKPVIEGGKIPDFLFPSAVAYDDLSFPASRLRMLAAKTTVKDRWRQVLNEANRIETKHLLTLQEGVSEGQFKEMQEAKVQLVVPEELHEAYPKSVQPHLVTLEGFVGDIRLTALP
ncbi:type II restriction endonuclease [Mesorhizobium sp. M1A.F.Ca.IN.022.02.1.1]|uniref:type II restriction endonuclease n=1 Tax=Mesorhizobium sp. M1A.F.Ca.IN.022.02.1.1 TaxID=2496766 RepID=UPI000FCC5227|nr:type II restriction endonuclease [Mesorhizobium sp. M1A.F.Ca.IN.022.02.1.1]RUV57362.1 type II restriction endonuclease [Mesorhizobium sp. M1A.F.Ca.IN.022.02.1.1]